MRSVFAVCCAGERPRTRTASAAHAAPITRSPAHDAERSLQTRMQRMAKHRHKCSGSRSTDMNAAECEAAGACGAAGRARGSSWKTPCTRKVRPEDSGSVWMLCTSMGRASATLCQHAPCAPPPVPPPLAAQADPRSTNYAITGLAWSPDATKLAVAQSDNIVFVYKVRQLRAPPPLPAAPSPPSLRAVGA